MSDSFRNIGANSWKDPVNTTVDLPTVGNQNGDVRLVLSDGSLWRWDSATTSWETAGGSGSFGYYYIAPTQVLKIPQYTEMIVTRQIINDGRIIADGKVTIL